MRQYRHVLYVAAITLVVTLGGLLFGYDTAVISGAEQAIEVYLIDSLGLGSFAHGLTVSSALIGCIVGGIISGFFSNRIGRKNTLLLAAVLFGPVSPGICLSGISFFQRGGTDVWRIDYAQFVPDSRGNRDRAGLCDRSNLYRGDRSRAY